jgi:hypothetical protein
MTQTNALDRSFKLTSQHKTIDRNFADVMDEVYTTSEAAVMVASVGCCQLMYHDSRTDRTIKTGKRPSLYDATPFRHPGIHLLVTRRQKFHDHLRGSTGAAAYRHGILKLRCLMSQDPTSHLPIMYTISNCMTVRVSEADAVSAASHEHSASIVSSSAIKRGFPDSALCLESKLQIRDATHRVSKTKTEQKTFTASLVAADMLCAMPN